MSELLLRATAHLARFIGRPTMFILCTLLAAGAIAAYVSKNELAINGTNLAINVLTLLFLPILQATQNRDGAALQAKLDELLRAVANAREAKFIGVEHLTDAEIEELRADLEALAEKKRERTAKSNGTSRSRKRPTKAKRATTHGGAAAAAAAAA